MGPSGRRRFRASENFTSGMPEACPARRYWGSRLIPPTTVWVVSTEGWANVPVT